MLALGTLIVAVLIVAAIRVAEMSWLERLALVGTALSPLLIIGSAYLVLRQVEEASSTIKAQLFDATAGRMLDLSRVFIDFPELRPYFYEGVDDATAPEPLRSRVRAVAELHLDYFDTELLRTRSFGRTLRGSLPSFDPWIRGLFRTSPAMCKRIEEDGALGEEGWYDSIHLLYRQVAALGEAAWMPAPLADE